MSTPAVPLLADLVAIDTTNPGGDEVALCSRLADELSARGADTVTLEQIRRPGSTGAMGAYVFAAFGSPTWLINIHVDTVPVNRGWTKEPFAATIEGDRVYGLGTADTKGAIAALLTALLDSRPHNVGVLFSGDEECSSTVLPHFIASEASKAVEHVIVCEPTGRAAGIAHRGIASYEATYHGSGGHSSRADTMQKPLVELARLALALDDLGRRALDSPAKGHPAEMPGLCMNVADVSGGVAYNVVPDSATLTWSIRQPPGYDMKGFDAAVRRLAKGMAVKTTLKQPAFACKSPDFFTHLLPNSRQVGLDFWTEASVFSQAGKNAVVIGPGDIAQAHAADEYVTLADLDWATDLFRAVMAASREC